MKKVILPVAVALLLAGCGAQSGENAKETPTVTKEQFDAYVSTVKTVGAAFENSQTNYVGEDLYFTETVSFKYDVPLKNVSMVMTDVRVEDSFTKVDETYIVDGTYGIVEDGEVTYVQKLQDVSELFDMSLKAALDLILPTESYEDLVYDADNKTYTYETTRTTSSGSTATMIFTYTFKNGTFNKLESHIAYTAPGYGDISTQNSTTITLGRQTITLPDYVVAKNDKDLSIQGKTFVCTGIEEYDEIKDIEIDYAGTPTPLSVFLEPYIGSTISFSDDEFEWNVYPQIARGTYTFASGEGTYVHMVTEVAGESYETPNEMRTPRAMTYDGTVLTFTSGVDAPGYSGELHLLLSEVK